MRNFVHIRYPDFGISIFNGIDSRHTVWRVVGLMLKFFYVYMIMAGFEWWFFWVVGRNVECEEEEKKRFNGIFIRLKYFGCGLHIYFDEK